MNFEKDSLFSVHMDPVFWEFLLGKDKEADHRVTTAKPYVAACYFRGNMCANSFQINGDGITM